jgi:hypothetical protein
MMNFSIDILLYSKGGESSIFKIGILKTLLNTKRRILLRGVLFSQRKSILKQGEKISNLDNASQNLIHLPLTICKRPLKRIYKKNLQKQNMWCKLGPK